MSSMTYTAGSTRDPFVKGLKKVLREVSTAQANGSLLQKAIMRQVAPIDTKQNKQTFKNQVDAETKRKWEPLKTKHAAYAKWKRRNWSGKKLLVWTGDARDSLTKASHKEHIAEVRQGIMTLGTSNRIIAEHMQERKWSTWQKSFLREKTPYQSKRKHKRTGKALKPRNWFTFWYKEVPQRRAVGKDARDILELKAGVSRGFYTRLATVLRPYTDVSRLARRAAGKRHRSA